MNIYLFVTLEASSMCVQANYFLRLVAHRVSSIDMKTERENCVFSISCEVDLDVHVCKVNHANNVRSTLNLWNGEPHVSDRKDKTRKQSLFVYHD